MPPAGPSPAAAVSVPGAGPRCSRLLASILGFCCFLVAKLRNDRVLLLLPLPPPPPPAPSSTPPSPPWARWPQPLGDIQLPPPRGSISWVPGPGWKWVIAPAFRLGGSPHPAVVGEKYFTPVHPCTDLCQGLYKSKWVFCLGALPRDRKYASEADGST